MISVEKKELLGKVNKAINEIRPHLQLDGGDIELVEVTQDNVLVVRWLGNCVNCSMAVMTMKAGIEQAVKSVAPEITSIVAINE